MAGARHAKRPSCQAWDFRLPRCALVLGKAGRPGVRVHRYRIFGLARHGDMADVAGEVPGHEDLVRQAAAAEDLLPGPGGLQSGHLPHLAQLGNQRFLVLFKVIHEVLRHRSLERRYGGGRAVAGVGHADFVFHLDHDHRVPLAVHGLDVPHEGRKGAGVGVAVRQAEGTEDLDALGPARRPDLGSREALEVPLHPVGRVARLPVLPTPEPQEHEAHVVAPCALDHAVKHVEVELSFLGLDLGPGNGGQHAVELRGNELGPYVLHVLEAGGGVVAQFARQGQKGLAVNDQLRGGPLLLQVRDVRL